MSTYSRHWPARSSARSMTLAKARYRSGWAFSLGFAVAVALTPVYLKAADDTGKASHSKWAGTSEAVEMFQAMKDGQIEVTLIPKDSKQSNVLIKNKTERPLRVQLPDAFAGVPVLAQIGGIGGGLGGGGLGGGGLSGGGQGLGGGFGGGLGGGGGIGGGGLGGGFFSVPPERVGKLKVTTVCLEHGKPEPRPAMKYETKPIAAFTDNEEVHELCRMLGAGLIDQRSAQAAAWHLNNHMSWQQLAAKRLEFANGATQPYFSTTELQRAIRVVSMAGKLAQQRFQGQDQSSSMGQP